MATTDPPHLRQQIDQHYRGEAVRVAAPLGSLDPTRVTDGSFALEQEAATTPVRIVATLTSSVPDGQNGVQRIAASAVDPQPVPPLDPAATVYEAVVQTQTGVPAGWYRFDYWLTIAGIGPRVVAAGRLHLREPALT